jgi:hypothetical protein
VARQPRPPRCRKPRHCTKKGNATRRLFELHVAIAEAPQRQVILTWPGSATLPLRPVGSNCQGSYTSNGYTEAAYRLCWLYPWCCSISMCDCAIHALDPPAHDTPPDLPFSKGPSGSGCVGKPNARGGSCSSGCPGSCSSSPPGEQPR